MNPNINFSAYINTIYNTNNKYLILQELFPAIETFIMLLNINTIINNINKQYI